jgi:hypothetical protein
MRASVRRKALEEGDAAMRYVIGTGLMLALLMGPAFSQVNIGGSSGKDQDWGPNQKAEALKDEAARRAKDIERDYNEATKKTMRPGTTVSNDPWGSIRSSPAASKPKQ